MRPRVAFLTAVRGALAGALAVALPVLTGGCSDDPPAPEPTAGVDASPVEARDQLAALAAAAEDRHLTARYTYAVAGRVDRTVTVTEAGDGTWRVDVPQAGADGVTDVAVARTAEGTFQCAAQSVDRPEGSACVRVADPDGPVPGPADPRVQHPFTDWREVLTDRRAPLSVSTSPPLPGARGACFAVESTSASLRAPMDPGIYCYERDGTLTAVRADFGTLLLAGAPDAAPATVTLPGPVVTTDPVPVG
jgi:hypothetical protein